MTSAIRLRRLLAEDEPVIVGYDQEEFARRLHYDRPIAASLDGVQGARATTTARFWTGMSEAEWAREGTHTESGATLCCNGSRSTPTTRTITRTRSVARGVRG